MTSPGSGSSGTGSASLPTPTLIMGPALANNAAFTVSSIDAHVALPPAAYVPLFSMPAGSVSATVNYRIVSQNLGTTTLVRAAIVDSSYVTGSPPGNDTWIQPVDLPLGPEGIQTGVSEDTGVIMSPGTTLVVYASLGATARIHGFLKSLPTQA